MRAVALYASLTRILVMRVHFAEHPLWGVVSVTHLGLEVSHWGFLFARHPCSVSLGMGQVDSYI